jgi:hypothetical protein
MGKQSKEAAREITNAARVWGRSEREGGWGHLISVRQQPWEEDW